LRFRDLLFPLTRSAWSSGSLRICANLAAGYMANVSQEQRIALGRYGGRGSTICDERTDAACGVSGSYAPLERRTAGTPQVFPGRHDRAHKNL